VIHVHIYVHLRLHDLTIVAASLTVLLCVFRLSTWIYTAYAWVATPAISRSCVSDFPGLLFVWSCVLHPYTTAEYGYLQLTYIFQGTANRSTLPHRARNVFETLAVPGRRIAKSALVHDRRHFGPLSKNISTSFPLFSVYHHIYMQSIRSCRK
jgi:hypothetical protein